MSQKDNILKFKNLAKNDSSINSQTQRDMIKERIMEKFNVSSSEAERILSQIEKRNTEEILKNQIHLDDSKKQVSKEVHNRDSSSEAISSQEGFDENVDMGSGKDLTNLDDSKKQGLKRIFKRYPSSEAISSQEGFDENVDMGSGKGLINLDDSKKQGLKRIFKRDSSSEAISSQEVLDKEDDINQNYLNNKIPDKELLNDKPELKTTSSNKMKSPMIQEEIKKPKHDTSFNSDLEMNKNSKNVDSILGEIIPDYNQQISIKVDHVDLTFEVSNEKIDTLKEMFIRTVKRTKTKKIKIHALKDVSFQIYKGEKIGIIGYNGAGKSTLLNVISGIYPPDKGNVITYGNISPLLSLGAGFDYNFSGRRNIIINGAVLGYDREFLESKMDEIIEFSELGEFIDIPIKNYSSGMLAKLGFSIATIVNPDILIIDEVLGVGDVNFAKKSKDKMKSLMDGGTTVLFVSHSIPQVRELCDKAIWIDKGSVRAIGEVNKICDEYLKDAEKASNEQLANIQLVNK